jgi:hypothetical protein
MKVGPWPLQRILGKATLTKALGTADQDKAERLAGQIILEFKRQIAAAQLKQLRRLTPADAFRLAPQDRVYTTRHWHGPLLSTSALPDGSLIRVVALERFLTICHPVPNGVNSPKGGISSHIIKGLIGLSVTRHGLRGSIGH